MDQYRSRLKLSENFERQWSMPISGKFIWTTIIGPYLFPGDIHMDQWSRKFFKSFPLHWHWSMDGSSLFPGGEDPAAKSAK